MKQAKSDYEWMANAPATIEAKREMKTLNPLYDWMQEIPVTEAVKPLTNEQEQIIKLTYQKEEVERAVELWKGRFKDIENKFYDFMQDYKKLDTDYRNEVTENDRLQQVIESQKDIEQMNIWLMKHHLQMKENPVKIDEGEVNNQWR